MENGHLKYTYKKNLEVTLSLHVISSRVILDDTVHDYRGFFDVGEYFAKIYHAAAFTADPRPDRHHIFILCHNARGWK